MYTDSSTTHGRFIVGGSGTVTSMYVTDYCSAFSVSCVRVIVCPPRLHAGARNLYEGIVDQIVLSYCRTFTGIPR